MTKSEATRLFTKILDSGMWEAEKPEAWTKDYKFDRAVEVAAIITGITESLVKKELREKESVSARNLVYRYLRKNGFTYMEIGDRFGLAHCTVMHGIKKLKGFIDIKDAETIRLITDFDNLID